MWISASRMPVDKFANMEEKLWILEDLNMMYIRQIALSLQVKVCLLLQLTITCFLLLLLLFYAVVASLDTMSKLRGVSGEKCVCDHVSDSFTFLLLIIWPSNLNNKANNKVIISAKTCPSLLKYSASLCSLQLCLSLL